MTLQDFFNLLSDNPFLILAYFILVPITAILAGILGKNEGHLTPWKYLYSALIFMVAVPGIFAITLSIYLFLFERRSILQTDVYTQILPVVSMMVTFFIVRKNVAMEYIPGFDKLSGLVMMIFTTLAVMWFLVKFRILGITFIPFQYIIFIFIGLFILFRYGWKNMTRS